MTVLPPAFSSGPADRPEIRGLYVCWLLVKSVVEAGCRFDKPGTVSVSQTGRVVVWKFGQGGGMRKNRGAGPINSAKFLRCSALQYVSTEHSQQKYPFRNAFAGLTRALLGLWIFHRLLGGGGGVWTPPPMISAPGRRREKGKAAFESSRKIISKSFRSFFASGQNWGLQGSKFKKFPKRVFNDKIFNFKGRATILISSCFSRWGASNHI